MKQIPKLLLIVGIAPFGMFAAIFFGPVLLMMASNTVSGYIISSTPNDAFEGEFGEIPEVSLFIERYPIYGTSHGGDIIGWKAIHYKASEPDGGFIHLHVKKNVLHQGVRISAGCNDGTGQSFAFDIPHERVIEFLNGGGCRQE